MMTASGCFIPAMIMAFLSMFGFSQMMPPMMSEPMMPPPPMEQTLPQGCVDSYVDGQLDAVFIAPINTYNNTEAYVSSDGTCTEGVMFMVTAIQAFSYEEAMAVCESYGQVASPTTFAEEGYPLSPDVWYCQ